MSYSKLEYFYTHQKTLLRVLLVYTTCCGQSFESDSKDEIIRLKTSDIYCLLLMLKNMFGIFKIVCIWVEDFFARIIDRKLQHLTRFQRLTNLICDFKIRQYHSIISFSSIVTNLHPVMTIHMTVIACLKQVLFVQCKTQKLW